MKLKATWVTVFALSAVFAAYACGQQAAGSSSSTQAKIEALTELRDSGVLS
jgi:hypothetical protein